jgi:hypothetical protein
MMGCFQAISIKPILSVVNKNCFFAFGRREKELENSTVVIIEAIIMIQRVPFQMMVAASFI